MVISFLGVQTDTVLESSYGNMSALKKFQLEAQNYVLAVDPYMPPRRTGMHNKFQFKSQNNEFAVDRNTHPQMTGLHN